MSTINVDLISPSTVGIVDVNGVKIEGANNTVYLGDQGNIPNSNGSVIIGAGAAGASTGSSNIAIGQNAMNGSSTAYLNVCIGASAGQSLTAGISNTLIGNGAGLLIQNPIPFGSGDNNVCVGANAGNTLTTGIGNTFIGTSTGTVVSNITGSGNTCIGNIAAPSSDSAMYEFTLGSQVWALRCQQTSITSLSDARDKKEIEELPIGLDFVKGLKPVKFIWDDRDEDGRHDIKDFGFIAQDLKKSQEDAELADTLKLVYESNPEKLEASYGKLVPILVKAIQDLSKELETLKNK
jgi:hypothetical protein